MVARPSPPLIHLYDDTDILLLIAPFELLKWCFSSRIPSIHSMLSIPSPASAGITTFLLGISVTTTTTTKSIPIPVHDGIITEEEPVEQVVLLAVRPVVLQIEPHAETKVEAVGVEVEVVTGSAGRAADCVVQEIHPRE